MIEVKVSDRTLIQIENARKYYLKLANKIEDMTPVFKAFKTEYKEIVNQNFEARGKIMERQRWRVYTPAYLKFKKKKFPGKQMLVVTEKLRKKALNFDSTITKDKMRMEVKGDDYFYHVSDRMKYGRKYFYTKNFDMPIQAWRLLIELTKKYLTELGNA